MSTGFGERLASLIDKLGMKKVEFAEYVKVDQSYITQLTNGRRNPSVRLIEAICQKFNVNENWLRDGKGDMFGTRSAEDEIEAAVRKIASGKSEDFKRRFIIALSGLDEEHWELLEKKMREIVVDRPLPKPEEIEKVIYYVPRFLQPLSAGTGETFADLDPESLEIKKEPPKGTSFVAQVKGNSMEPTYQDGDLVFVKAQPEVAPGEIGAFYMDGQMWIKELGDCELISHNPDPEYAPRPFTEDIKCQGLVLGVCDRSYFE